MTVSVRFSETAGMGSGGGKLVISLENDTKVPRKDGKFHKLSY